MHARPSTGMTPDVRERRFSVRIVVVLVVVVVLDFLRPNEERPVRHELPGTRQGGPEGASDFPREAREEDVDDDDEDDDENE